MPAHYGYYHWPGCLIQSFPADSEVKASASNVGDLGLIPGLRRSPGEGNGNPLQFPCRNFLENPMDREAWWTTVPGVTKELDTNYWSNINKWYLSWDLKDENRSGSPRSGWGEGRELQTNERIRPNVGQDATSLENWKVSIVTAQRVREESYELRLKGQVGFTLHRILYTIVKSLYFILEAIEIHWSI